jgi:hypothetical protein
MTKEGIKTEALRIARAFVKAELKRQGIKVAFVEASEISEASRYLVKADPDILRIAKNNLRRIEYRKRKLWP